MSIGIHQVEARFGKLAAGFTNSAGMSGDKLLSLQQLAGFAAQHGMICVTLGQLPGWQTSAGSAEVENRLASFLGLMSQSNADQGPDKAPPPSDRAPAERFGRRIGEAAHRWTRGRAFAAVALFLKMLVVILAQWRVRVRNPNLCAALQCDAGSCLGGDPRCSQIPVSIHPNEQLGAQLLRPFWRRWANRPRCSV